MRGNRQSYIFSGSMFKLTSKTILKLTAITVLAESVYALVQFKWFYPMQICGAIVSLFASNSVHEHVETYFKQKIDKDAQ